ncbi:MAG: glycoside hydrolase family 2 [Firmicutes bacterium]|nr:glycoside hydrolase family 2 [Bacillota bacterium]
MQNKETNNFVSDIHDEGYQGRFAGPLINHKSMIYDCNRDKESLNGCWNFHIDPYHTFLRADWFLEVDEDKDGRELPVDYSFDNWEEVAVPSCWNNVKKEYLYYEGLAIYTRTFKYINQGEDRVFLKIGAANYETYLFLNKKFLGKHRGGSTPFFVEITSLLEENNRIHILVDNTRQKLAVPTINTDWFNYGGLYRDVELIRLPDDYIKDFSIALKPDGNYNSIQVELGTNRKDAVGTASLEIPALGIKQDIELRKGMGSCVITATPDLWSPDNPYLYDLTISYKKDLIKEKVGFREIRVKGRDIHLNGEKIFLKGIACHEDSLIHGKAVTEEEIIENIILAKEMNCNYLRLAHYPHSSKAARLADEMGLMLWEEIPVYWAVDFASKSTYLEAENQLLEMIKRDKNRASVIIWSIGNENQDSDERLKFMSRLANMAREIDPTRLVSAACLVDELNNQIADRLIDHLDIIGLNEYYGWYEPDFNKLAECLCNSKPDKPVIITEFGAGALAGYRGTRDDLFTEDYQYRVYKKQIEVLEKTAYIRGLSPWILFDFRCPRRTNKYQAGYNLKGLLSRDKKHKKLAFYVMKDFYQRV